MAKTLTTLHLILALVFLPVAQGYATPIDFEPNNTMAMDMSHCKDMNNGVCGDKADCLSSGMLCLDGLSSVLLEESELSIRAEKNHSIPWAGADYVYLSVYSILRPPRSI